MVAKGSAIVVCTPGGSVSDIVGVAVACVTCVGFTDASLGHHWQDLGSLGDLSPNRGIVIDFHSVQFIVQNSFGVVEVFFHIYQLDVLWIQQLSRWSLGRPLWVTMT